MDVIYRTIGEFEEIYPNNPNNMQFYHSEIIFSKLLNYVYYKTEFKDTVLEEFKKKPYLRIPPIEQLDEFFKLFISNVNNDKKLKKLYHEGNFQEEIFNISTSLSNLHYKIAKVDKGVGYLVKEKIKETMIYDPSYIVDSLIKQANKQIQKQLNSGKYLPDTFLEIGEQKDHLRYLCHPILYAEKVFNEIGIYDFRELELSLLKKGKSSFSFGWDRLINKPRNINIDNCNDFISSWGNHLQEKLMELNSFSEDGKSGYEYIFRDRFRDLDFLKSSLALITETAGQGKTNLLCDFVKNFLIKHQIPTIFVTGAELDAANISQSILQRIFPKSNKVSFQTFLEAMKTICYKTNKFFIIVIDGINENVNPKLLRQNIEDFIEELLDQTFIRVIISCRTEYFESNFNNLMKSSFLDKTRRITSLTVDRMDEHLKLKLFYTYMRHFTVSFDSITNAAYDQLVSNFLILRIFCETYSKTHLGYIDNIYKQELFRKYYELKSDEINKRIDNNDEFDLKGKINIQEFIGEVITYMITYKQYFNIPLDDLIKGTEKRDVYIRFLDENILIKRDLDSNESGIFLPSEVVNFTFDEFRDFLISEYLVDNIFKNSVDEFEEFLNNELNQNSSIKEGCATYLFFASRKSKSVRLLNIVKTQPWYQDVFIKNIFSVKENQITEEDMHVLSFYIKKNSTYSKFIIETLIYRRNLEYFNVLNIESLFATIRSMNDFEFDNFINIFIYEEISYFNTYSKINLDKIFKELDSNLYENEEREFDDKLFELMLYLFTSEAGYRARSLYERFTYKFKKKSIIQIRKALLSKSEVLLSSLYEFVKKYEINI